MAARTKAAKGLAWLIGGRLGSAVLSIISTAVLARLLTPADFGVVAATMLVLALANVIFDGAFGINLMRKKELHPADVRTTLTVGLLVSGLLVAILIIASPAIERFFKFQGLAHVLMVCSVVIPFKAVFAIATALLQRAGRFRFIAFATLAGQLFGYILLGIPLSLAGCGVWSLVAAMVMAGFVEALFTSLAAKLSFRPQLDAGVVRDIRNTSLFSVGNMLSWVANTAANTIVGATMGAAGLGLYSRGWKLLDLVVAATADPLSRVVRPMFARLHGEEERLARAFMSALGLAVPGYAVASVLLAIQAPLIVDLALGHQWTATVPVAQILFATLVPRCAFKISEDFAVAIGRSAAAALRQGLYAVLMIAGTLIGVRYSIVAVAFGVSAAITLFYIASMVYAIRVGRISASAVLGIHLKAALLVGAIAVTDLGTLHLLSGLPLLLKHLAGGAVGGLTALILLFSTLRFWLGDEDADYVMKAIATARARLPGLRRAGTDRGDSV
jgi:O-antigen/teichoic acid export membrane protein